MVFYFEWQGKGYFLKQYLGRHWLESLKSILRGNRSERTLRNHVMLAANGFNAPRVILTGRKGNLNFSVTESIAHFLNLRRYLEKIASEQTAAEFQIRKHRLIADLGRTVGQMHARAISHGDLRWGNIHVDDSREDSFQLQLIDNERTVRHLALPERMRLKNLVQLNIISHGLVSVQDRYRFFSAYLKENPCQVPHKRSLLKKVIHRTGQRIKNKQQRSN